MWFGNDMHQKNIKVKLLLLTEYKVPLNCYCVLHYRKDVFIKMMLILGKVFDNVPYTSKHKTIPPPC